MPDVAMTSDADPATAGPAITAAVDAPPAPAPPSDADLDALLTAPEPPTAPVEAPAKPRLAPHGVRSNVGHGWLAISDNGFIWTPEPADALVVLTEKDALALAKFAFPGIAVEIVG